MMRKSLSDVTGRGFISLGPGDSIIDVAAVLYGAAKTFSLRLRSMSDALYNTIAPSVKEMEQVIANGVHK